MTVKSLITPKHLYKAIALSYGSIHLIISNLQQHKKYKKYSYHTLRQAVQTLLYKDEKLLNCYVNQTIQLYDHAFGSIIKNILDENMVSCKWFVKQYATLAKNQPLFMEDSYKKQDPLAQDSLTQDTLEQDSPVPEQLTLLGFPKEFMNLLDSHTTRES